MKNRTRENIIKSAASLFYNKGYNSTGVNELIKEAGIVKSTLYQHFKSKEEIGIAYLKQTKDAFFDELLVFMNEENEPKKRLLSIFLYLNEQVQKNSWSGCQFFNIFPEVPASSDIAYEVFLHKTKLRELFVEEASKLPGENNSLAMTLFLLFEGALMDSRIFKSQKPVSYAIDGAKLLLKD